LHVALFCHPKANQIKQRKQDIPFTRVQQYPHTKISPPENMLMINFKVQQYPHTKIFPPENILNINFY